MGGGRELGERQLGAVGGAHRHHVDQVSDPLGQGPVGAARGGHADDQVGLARQPVQQHLVGGEQQVVQGQPVLTGVLGERGGGHLKGEGLARSAGLGPTEVGQREGGQFAVEFGQPEVAVLAGRGRERQRVGAACSPRRAAARSATTIAKDDTSHTMWCRDSANSQSSPRRSSAARSGCRSRDRTGGSRHRGTRRRRARRTSRVRRRPRPRGAGVAHVGVRGAVACGDRQAQARVTGDHGAQCGAEGLGSTVPVTRNARVTL